MLTSKNCLLLTLSCFFANALSVASLAEEPAAVVTKDFSHETPAEKAERMEWFNDARFGMFIHWGLYAQPAGVWKGKDVGGIGEWIQDRAKIPVSEYSELQKTFNPIKYNADAWVKIAKQAGMKYIVITSKHHDGFCLFDSAHTDWDIGGTPYKKDLLKPLAEACKKHGLKLCFYHSIMDWHHPQYGNKAEWRGNHATEKPDMEIYRTYMKNQLQELLTNYGDVGIVWFDGEWESSWNHEQGIDLYNYCRSLQPRTIVNNRVDKGRSGMAGMTKKGEFRGDYGTPEQEIPHTGFGKGVYWESCMTMNNTWGFKSKDHNWKSNEKLIRNLIDIASKGGNFLLNIGPTAEGEIPSPSIERLQAMGEWMATNGESIYGTTASPFEKTSWNGRCTQKPLPDGKTRLYLHLFDWPKDGQLVVKTLKNRPLRAAILGSDEQVTIEGKEGHWVLELPASAPDEIASVVTLDIEGSPEVMPYRIEPDTKGVFHLSVDEAKLTGKQIRVEEGGGVPRRIGYWTDAAATVSWKIEVAEEGTYRPALRISCDNGSAGSKVAFTIGDERREFVVKGTGTWYEYTTLELDPVTLSPGVHDVVLQAITKPKLAVMNVQSVTLIPVE